MQPMRMRAITDATKPRTKTVASVASGAGAVIKADLQRRQLAPLSPLLSLRANQATVGT